MQRFILFLIIGLLCIGCAHKCDYTRDYGISSAEANSHEFDIKLQGMVCRTTSRKIGACLEEVRRDHTLKIFLPAKQYPYRVEMNCSTKLGYTFTPIRIEKNQSYTIEIDTSFYDNINSRFSCEGEIFPLDARNDASLKFLIVVILVDKNYQAKEQITRQGKYLVFGTDSLYCECLDKKGKIKHWKKITAVKDKKFKYKKCICESHMGKVAHYGN